MIQAEKEPPMHSMKHAQNTVFGEVGCPFCDRSQIKSPITDIDDMMVFEPLNPVTAGHLLIVPRAHVEDFAESPYTSSRAMRIAARIAAAKGGDFNIITSKGKAATQSVRHLHFHLVPRTEGDGLRLPWSRDSDGSPEGRDREDGLDGEAATARAEGIAQ